jgi:Lrp/AsnC family leucine-responsive transcriptional regulator
MDSIDHRIVDLLIENARISLKNLGEKIGLSSPSTSERLKRLEETRVIRGFTIDVDPTLFGYSLQAIVRIRPLPGKLHIVQKMIVDIPQISECDKVTGDDCFICRLHFQDMAQMDKILDWLANVAETTSSIVKSQPVMRRLPPLTQPGLKPAGV